MPDSVMIVMPVDADAAELLQTNKELERMGQLVSKLARLRSGHDPLAAVLEATAQDARAAGLTDDEIDAELAAHKAERTR